MQNSNADTILDLLGCSTRRRILELLSEQPCFVSEISELLDVGRKAIIDHLSALENSGFITSVERPVKKGRPRKYYEIEDSSFFKVSISPLNFEFTEVKAFRELPKLEKIHDTLDELESRPFNQRQLELQKIRAKLKKRVRELETEWVETSRLLNRARRIKF